MKLKLIKEENMSLIPAFEVGVWNAWILTTVLFLLITLSGQISKDIGKKIAPTEEVKKRNSPMMVVFFTLLIYSIFLPLKLWTAWFYAGLAVYLLGFIISILALVSVASTKPGEPFTTGVYRYSRHPISLGTLLPLIGVGIASASWLFLLLSAVLAVISYFLAIIEEEATARKFGDTYREYMKKTPRWLGIPKS
jgi:protein-S-isoprenylcysteine O-methyltransferase Ste14